MFASSDPRHCEVRRQIFINKYVSGINASKVGDHVKAADLHIKTKYLVISIPKHMLTVSFYGENVALVPNYTY